MAIFILAYSADPDEMLPYVAFYCKFRNLARVLFSRNFADADFRDNKTFAKWRKIFVLY